MKRTPSTTSPSLLGVSLRTVQSWISDGELRAVSVSRSRSSRKPRLRILDADLQAFLSNRAVGSDPPAQRRRRRSRRSSNTSETPADRSSPVGSTDSPTATTCDIDRPKAGTSHNWRRRDDY